MPKVSPQWLRDVLKILYQHHTVTRGEIIHATGLNPASLSHTLQFLLDRGTIFKVGELQSKGGRPREVIMLNSEAGYFVAVDLEGSRIRFALTNFVGDIRYRWEQDLEFGDTLSVGEIQKGIDMVLKNLGSVQLSRLLAVGISSPGMVDKDGNITAFNLGWQRIPLVRELRRSIDFPIFLDHGTRVSVLAEKWHGLGQNVDNFMYVMVGYGIGVGIFSNGSFVGGRDQMAGEIGHITVDPRAKDVCKCGKKGCLEAVASSPNIVRQYFEKKRTIQERPSGYRVYDVFEAARRKDRAALQVLNRAGTHLGLALAYLVNLLNPELIILGGDLLNGADLMLPEIRKQIEKHALSDFVKNLEILPSTLGFDIGLKGAASLAFNSCINDRELLEQICSPVVEVHAQKTSRAAAKARRRRV